MPGTGFVNGDFHASDRTRRFEAPRFFEFPILDGAKFPAEKRALTCLKHFRYAYLTRSQGSAAAASGGHGSQDNLLAQPVALGKLARFLVDIHRDNGKWVGTKARPLILLVGDVLCVSDQHLLISSRKS